MKEIVVEDLSIMHFYLNVEKRYVAKPSVCLHFDPLFFYTLTVLNCIENFKIPVATHRHLPSQKKHIKNSFSDKSTSRNQFVETVFPSVSRMSSTRKLECITPSRNMNF